MIRVLFVCYGNICRSPMAEVVFGKYVKEAALAECFEIASAGTSDEEDGTITFDETAALKEFEKASGGNLSHLGGAFSWKKQDVSSRRSARVNGAKLLCPCAASAPFPQSVGL